MYMISYMTEQLDLKRAITAEPVLTPPKDARPFIVKTDGATQLGIAGILSQRDDDGRERVVAYYGRTLSPARILRSFFCFPLSPRSQPSASRREKNLVSS